MRALRNALIIATVSLATMGSATCSLAAVAGGLLAQAPPAGGAVVVESGRSFVLEGIVVAALFGLALFAVCRSSRRS